MTKRDEISNPKSCFNKAKDDELIFILLERDKTITDVIQFWVEKRIELGLNVVWDKQITEAMEFIELVNQRSD